MTSMQMPGVNFCLELYMCRKFLLLMDKDKKLKAKLCFSFEYTLTSSDKA